MTQGEDSEDCLYLNIWEPRARTPGGKRLPVYVFIHGGAFQEGATSIAVYDGASLAAHGVLVVTIQYRLGVFGFLAHPELTAESPEHASGNYGLLDCLAALRWIKANIAAFGGDPSRVTVGGQSAGAAAVHALLASPLARGLIQGAIAESGSSLGPPMKSLSAAESEGEAFAATRGARSLAELRTLPAESLLPAATDSAGVRFAPVVDGWCLPEDPNAALAGGRTMDVPLLTGMQADEGSSSAAYGHASVVQLQQLSREMFGTNQTRFAALYPFSDDREASEVSRSSARDRGLASMYLWAARTSRYNRSPVYTYYWAHALPWPEHPEFGSFHSSEVPYVLGNLQVMRRPFTAADHTISVRASEWWANFIRTGNPNRAGFPHWEPYQENNPETMEIEAGGRMRPLMSPERLAFWRYMLLARPHVVGPTR